MQTATKPTGGPGDFRSLVTQVRAAGLLDRRRGYYTAKIVITTAAFGAGWAAFFMLGSSWATIALAAYLGVMSTQLGFLGHDAGHGQIFNSRRANRLLGEVIGNGLLGFSFGWWVDKHNAHHAYPNQVDRDPDIGVGLVSRSPGDNETEANGRRWPARLFFPLMLLRSTGLYVSSVQELLRRRDRAAITERLMITAHAALYLTAIFVTLPPLMAIAFIAVHQGVFSLYLGCSFAPNHKGMPIIEGDSRAGFAQRQVMTSRNLIGGRYMGLLFGGLNYQIEHHLFPTMPRPNLVRAREIVRAFCDAADLSYCEASLVGSFRQALDDLRRPRAAVLVI